MTIQTKTLEKLRNLINEETEYRSGPQIVSFFNDLGFNDVYKTGFPSRWIYTDEKLAKINGTSDLDKCIKKVFSPLNFIGNFEKLDNHINDFNNFLSFDNWIIVRNGKEITFKKTTDDFFNRQTTKKQEISEDTFLTKEFDDINLERLNLEYNLTMVLKERIAEVEKSLKAECPLSVIFLCGSTLEGILLGVATKFPQEFNSAKSKATDKNGKVRQFHDWTLNNFIDTSYELGIIKEDVKKFSHSLKDFRNYIHPFQQLHSNFSPDINTAKISSQVLKAGINQIINYMNKNAYT